MAARMEQCSFVKLQFGSFSDPVGFAPLGE
ncbi:MAG: hypothetical protein JWQ33_1377 [Ramlibacter sp.]|nr:hypothetical protein [Ramlibacter sp.]